MGLFDFLKPQPSLFDKTIADLNKKLFPGGKTQKDDGAREVMRLSNGKLNFDKALEVFIQAKARVHLYQDRSTDQFIKGIIIDSENTLTYPEATAILKFARNGIEEPAKTKEEVLVELFKVGLGMNGDGFDLDEIPNGFGEFGHAVTNPIPVKGIISNKIYLDKLRTKNGEKILYERIASYQSENIKHSIDGYTIYDLNKNQIAILYLSPYHKRVSNKAPRGFIIEEKK